MEPWHGMHQLLATEVLLWSCLPAGPLSSTTSLLEALFNTRRLMQ